MAQSVDSPAAPLHTEEGSGDRATELIDILEVQRTSLIAVAVGVSVLGLAITAVFPGLLASTATTGLAVGASACLLGVAAAIVADAADRYVRGPRHVMAAGGSLAAVIDDRHPGAELIDELDRLTTMEDGIRVAIAPTGIDAARSHELADNVGLALARGERRVLVVDVSRAGMDAPGIAEASRGSVPLSDVVDMHPDLQLATVGPGRDLPGAIEGFPRIAGKLPRDVDALIVAAPGVRHVGVLPALTAVDRVLLLVESGRTDRAELMAVLDALDVAGIPVDVILANGHAARRFGPFEPRSVEPGGDVPEEAPSGGVTVLGETRPPTEPGGLAATTEIPPVDDEPRPDRAAPPSPGTDGDRATTERPHEGADGAGPDHVDEDLRRAASIDTLVHRIGERNEVGRDPGQ